MQEKEAALNLTVDAFCRLVKQHANVAQLVTMYDFPLLISSTLQYVFLINQVDNIAVIVFASLFLQKKYLPLCWLELPLFCFS